jgi:hypothetical protein
MNKQLTMHIKGIQELRKALGVRANIDKEGELSKIWARWIITHRSLFKQDYIYLPGDTEYDYQLLTELHMKGCVNTKEIYKYLMECCSVLNSRMGSLTSSLEFGGIHGSELVNVKEEGKYVILECDGISDRLPISVYKKMGRMYRNAAMAPEHLKNGYIWLTMTLYSLLDGKGLQWAVPSAVMAILKQDMGCDVELFASPINSMHMNYYSLFPYDRYFGSRGNFFNTKDDAFIEGTYQINPPFIISLFVKTTEKILRLLEIADLNNKNLTFIYIMPEWDDFTAYNMVSESRFCMKQIKLEAGHHYYYQYSTGGYIKARFGTLVIFLSTDMKCCGNELEKAIKIAFAQPFNYSSLFRGNRY